MDPANIGLFSLAERRLAWVDQRQTLLSQNVANADTPGYRSRDLTPFAAHLGRLGLTPSESGSSSLGTTLSAAGAGTDRARERAVDGNAVGLEDQLAKIADSDGTQQLVTGLYHKYMGLFMTALGKS
jgi:flagellar basal-body rod protein FlgB